MIRWSSKPTKWFSNFITESLDDAIDCLGDEMLCNENESGYFRDDIVTMFGGLNRIRNILKELAKVHELPEIYQLTDYHWVLLDRIVYINVCLYNDGTWNNGVRPKKQLNKGEILDDFFWDSDYELSPDIFGKLTGEQKASFGFSPETFGVINRLTPHPDEVKIELYEDQDDPGWL